MNTRPPNYCRATKAPDGFRRRPMALASCALVATMAMGVTARAEPDPQPQANQDVTVSVLTFGPGEHPFLRFGHTALLIRDRRRNRSDVYNYGTFSFESPTLISDFLKGRLTYWLSDGPLYGTLAAYRREQRWVLEQQLALSEAQSREVAEALSLQALPANRAYKYHYYRDNCSTRVRDVVDKATHGRLFEALQRPARLSWREHTLEATREVPWLTLGLDFAMGQLIDHAGPAWEDLFSPLEIPPALRQTTVIDDGNERPLVAREAMLLAPQQPEPTRSRWSFRRVLALAGLPLGGLLAALGHARHTAARIAFAVGTGIIGAALGLPGLAIALLWAFTDHDVTFWNENVLACPPFCWLLLFLSVPLAFGSRRALAWTRGLALAAGATALLGVMVKALPFASQQNWPFLAFFCPLWFGIALGSQRLLARAAPAPYPACRPASIGNTSGQACAERQQSFFMRAAARVRTWRAARDRRSRGKRRAPGSCTFQARPAH